MRRILHVQTRSYRPLLRIQHYCMVPRKPKISTPQKIECRFHSISREYIGSLCGGSPGPLKVFRDPSVPWLGPLYVSWGPLKSWWGSLGPNSFSFPKKPWLRNGNTLSSLITLLRQIFTWIRLFETSVHLNMNDIVFIHIQFLIFIGNNNQSGVSKILLIQQFIHQ